LTLLLAATALLPALLPGTGAWRQAAAYADYLLLVLLLAEIILDARRFSTPFMYLRRSAVPLLLALLFVLLLLYSRLLLPTEAAGRVAALTRGVLVLRNVLLLLRVFRRLHRLSSFFETITLHPAQTILYSFLGVIIIGTLLLMLPMTTPEGGLPPLGALFTATSAVCVTGLIVVDTATALSFWGQLIVLVLIQIGGLGIMIISYFSLFAARQSVSLEEKVLLSYILDERNMNAIAGRVKLIIYTTFLIEGLGAVLLFPAMRRAAAAGIGDGIFYALFHSISAFCNAGFSLFSDSLTGFSSDPVVIGTTALLIIFGGLSFSVLANLGEIAADAAGRLQLRTRLAFARGRAVRRDTGGGKPPKLSLNSQTVLRGTGLLLAAGLLLFYLLAHTGVLAELPTGAQYLHSFFQSVTLRTAGFNTVAIGNLSVTALLVMLPFMFIGGASGSTAGGIKINNAAIMSAYIRSVVAGRQSVVISHHSVSRTRVNRAFLVFLFGTAAVSVGTLLLSAVESFALERILFEAVSAFGTVGLSTGITAQLSAPSRWVIIALMYVGRVGPLTILAAASRPQKGVEISYPHGEILV